MCAPYHQNHNNAHYCSRNIELTVYFMISPFTPECENDPEPFPQKQLFTLQLTGTSFPPARELLHTRTTHHGPIKPKREDHLQMAEADLMSSNWTLSRPRVCLNIPSMSMTNNCEHKFAAVTPSLKRVEEMLPKIQV